MNQWHNRSMARGWESKSVESQMDEAASEFSEKHAQLTPEQQHRERERQGLLLARTRVERLLETATNTRDVSETNAARNSGLIQAARTREAAALARYVACNHCRCRSQSVGANPRRSREKDQPPLLRDVAQAHALQPFQGRHPVRARAH